MPPKEIPDLVGTSLSHGLVGFLRDESCSGTSLSKEDFTETRKGRLLPSTFHFALMTNLRESAREAELQLFILVSDLPFLPSLFFAGSMC